MGRGRYYKTIDGKNPENFLLSLWAEEGVRLRTKDAIKMAKQTFPDLFRVSDTTINKWIVGLHKKGFLERESEGRSTYYTLNSMGHDRALKGMITKFITSSALNKNIVDWPHLHIFSDTNLTDLLNEDAVTKVNKVLFDLQSLFHEFLDIVADHHREYFNEQFFSQDDIEKIDYYYKNIDWFRDMESRYIASNVAGSPQENEQILREELKNVQSLGFNSKMAFINKYNPPSASRFHKILSGLPLTFEEYREFLELKSQIEDIYPLLKKYFNSLEQASPNIGLMIYSREVEEDWLLDSPFLIRAGLDDKVIFIDDVLDTLGKGKLEQYRTSLEKFLEDPVYTRPIWPGEPGKSPRLPPLKERYEDKNTSPRGLEWERWANKILKRISIIKITSSLKGKKVKKDDSNVMNMTMGELLAKRGVSGTRGFLDEICPKCLRQLQGEETICTGCGHHITKARREQP